MKLFGHPESGHAFKVRFFLRAAEIEHSYELVDIFAPLETRTESFRRHARFGEVPTLVDEGRAYVQSNSILVYLATKVGGWGAENVTSMQRCTEWLFWEANKIGMCLPQLRADKRLAGMQLEPDARRWLEARYQNDIGIMDHELADGRTYFLGDEPTIVDFALCGYLALVDEAQLRVPPHVDSWLERLRAMPAWEHPYDMLSANA